MCKTTHNESDQMCSGTRVIYLLVSRPVQSERHLHHSDLPLRHSPTALFAVNGASLTHVGCVLSLLEMSEVDKRNDSLELLISGQKGVYVTTYRAF